MWFIRPYFPILSFFYHVLPILGIDEIIIQVDITLDLIDISDECTGFITRLSYRLYYLVLYSEVE